MKAGVGLKAGAGLRPVPVLRYMSGDMRQRMYKAQVRDLRQRRREWILKEFRTDKGYSLWQTESRPIELWSNKVIEQKIDYIHYNPVEEGFVFNPEDYMYSSAYDYAGGKGMLDIEVIG